MRLSADRHVLPVLRKVLAARDGGLPMEQRRLAEKVGCSVETIRKIEKGQIKLSEDLAYKTAITTGVSREWLLANDLTVPPHRDFERSYTRKDFAAAQAKLLDPSWSGTLLDVASVDYAAALISSLVPIRIMAR